MTHILELALNALMNSGQSTSNLNSLTPNDQVSALLELAKIHRQQFDERRKYEWKVITMALTFCVALAAAKISNTSSFPPNASWHFVIALAAVWVSVALLLGKINNANAQNKLFAQQTEEAVRQLVTGKTSGAIDVNFPKVNGAHFFSEWGWRYIVIILLVISTITAVFVTR